MQVTYHPDAEAELTAAAAFYERQVSGLGQSFVQAFNLAIAKIEKQPELGPTVEGDVRRRSLRRFPYTIYYRTTGDELRVLAIKHHSRHPDYWRHRVGE